jgi:hypothetical protein
MSGCNISRNFSLGFDENSKTRNPDEEGSALDWGSKDNNKSFA